MDNILKLKLTDKKTCGNLVSSQLPPHPPCIERLTIAIYEERRRNFRLNPISSSYIVSNLDFSTATRQG